MPVVEIIPLVLTAILASIPVAPPATFTLASALGALRRGARSRTGGARQFGWGEDPVDGAIRAAAAGKPVADAPKLVKFAAFDPAKKMSEASATDAKGNPQRIVKGAHAVVIGLAQASLTAAGTAKELEGKGFVCWRSLLALPTE